MNLLLTNVFFLNVLPFYILSEWGPRGDFRELGKKGIYFRETRDKGLKMRETWNIESQDFEFGQ